jgi:hypothetical protein
MEKNKIQNKQSSDVTSKSDCVHVVEMDDEGLYGPDDILEGASAGEVA